MTHIVGIYIDFSLTMYWKQKQHVISNLPRITRGVCNFCRSTADEFDWFCSFFFWKGSYPSEIKEILCFIFIGTREQMQHRKQYINQKENLFKCIRPYFLRFEKGCASKSLKKIEKRFETINLSAKYKSRWEFMNIHFMSNVINQEFSKTKSIKKWNSQ